MPDVREKLQTQGTEPAGGSPTDLKQFQASESPEVDEGGPHGQGHVVSRNRCSGLGISRDFLAARRQQQRWTRRRWQRCEAIAGLEIETLAQPAQAPITRDDVCRYDALMIKRNPVNAALFDAGAAGTAAAAPARAQWRGLRPYRDGRLHQCRRDGLHHAGCGGAAGRLVDHGDDAGLCASTLATGPGNPRWPLVAALEPGRAGADRTHVGCGRAGQHRP